MLRIEEIQKVLLSAPLFSALEPGSSALRTLCEAAKVVDFGDGAVLFREGESGDCLYVIVSGGLRVWKETIPILLVREPGACIGEMALLGDEPRSATVRAEGETRLLRVDRDDFSRILASDVSIVRGVFGALNEKLRANLADRLRVERREIVRRESLRMTEEVQRSLLPQGEIDLPRLQTAGYTKPADIVGGDYYDYLDLGEGREGLFLADVMDHGLHSAMLMAMLKSGLHTQIRYDDSISGVLDAVSQIVDEQVGVFIYLTCCYVRFRPEGAEIEYVNAGNPPLLHFRSRTGTLDRLKSEYAPPGLLPLEDGVVFRGRTARWEVGDVLLAYSDGLAEARRLSGEAYGDDRIAAAMLGSVGRSALEILQAVLGDLKVFLEDAEPTDDVTLVVATARDSVVQSAGGGSREGKSA